MPLQLIVKGNSPANVCPLPWVQVALDALQENERVRHERQAYDVR